MTQIRWGSLKPVGPFDVAASRLLYRLLLGEAPSPFKAPIGGLHKT